MAFMVLNTLLEGLFQEHDAGHFKHRQPGLGAGVIPPWIEVGGELICSNVATPRSAERHVD